MIQPAWPIRCWVAVMVAAGLGSAADVGGAAGIDDDGAFMPVATALGGHGDFPPD